MKRNLTRVKTEPPANTGLASRILDITSAFQGKYPYPRALVFLSIGGFSVRNYQGAHHDKEFCLSNSAAGIGFDSPGHRVFPLDRGAEPQRQNHRYGEGLAGSGRSRSKTDCRKRDRRPATPPHHPTRWI